MLRVRATRRALQGRWLERLETILHGRRASEHEIPSRRRADVYDLLDDRRGHRASARHVDHRGMQPTDAVLIARVFREHAASERPRLELRSAIEERLVDRLGNEELNRSCWLIENAQLQATGTLDVPFSVEPSEWKMV